MLGMFKKSPKDIGRALALSLNTSVEIDANEAQSVQAAGLNPNHWFNEIYFLSGASVFNVLVAALGERSEGKEARAGFIEVFEKRAAADPTEAGLFRIFRSRMVEYNSAAEAEEPGMLDPITIKFMSFFPEGSGVAQVAYRFARDHYDAHFQSTIGALRAAKLAR